MYQKIKIYFLKVPAIFRNVFFLTGISFAVWMLFFDENNLMVQYNRRHELASLKKKSNYYKHEIEKVDTRFDELTTNTESQEKFARENYMMKKDSEDVFVIVQR
ncbi:MAG: septum formation initiator [Bacteroidetes bacterium]|nr:septum formation initiator [Bacteroidota bacterium]